VELSNGCICCTMRGDLLREVTRLAKQGAFDYLLIESTGVSEPMQVAASRHATICAPTFLPGTSRVLSLCYEESFLEQLLLRTARCRRAMAAACAVHGRCRI
jgi:hypothetical protein